MADILFTTDTRTYVENGFADVEGATDVEFNNQGNTDVEINGRKIVAGDWWSINGLQFEKNTGRYEIKFTSGRGLLAVTTRKYKAR